jgi:molecular chaperone GrpE
VSDETTDGTVEEQATAPPPEPAGNDGGAAEELLELSQEALLADLERVTAERDQYLDALRRNQADFENFRKRSAKQSADQAEVVAARLVEDLLPVLDACDGAIRHGAGEVEPIFAALLGTLEKGGLERIDPGGEAFDPTRHEAVMHEPAGEGDEGTVVADVMRPGYSWKGRVLRAAMVKVRG